MGGGRWHHHVNGSHYNIHMHYGDAFWVLEVLDSHFHAHIVQMTRNDTPFSVQCSVYLSFCSWKTRVP